MHDAARVIGCSTTIHLIIFTFPIGKSSSQVLLHLVLVNVIFEPTPKVGTLMLVSQTQHMAKLMDNQMFLVLLVWIPKVKVHHSRPLTFNKANGRFILSCLYM